MNTDKILNPATGRYVLKTGAIGKKILNSKKEKNININELKNEWQKIYNTTNSSNIINIIENKDNIISVKISKTEKIIGLSGQGTLIIRKIKDIALANKENTEIYLPKNFRGKNYANPLWNKVHGYMYYLNEQNIKNLSKIIQTINIINNKYKFYKISEDFIENTNKSFGIIGIDIPYKEAEWITYLVKGNPLYNPILNEKKEIIFSKCAISTKTIEKANIYLKKKLGDKFKLLYPKYIILRSTKTLTPLLENFINSEYTIANIAYDKHARTIFKNNNKLYIIDPWKQIPDAGTKNLIKIISNLEFIKREKEQTNEGSCTAVSYARTLYMTFEGVDKLYEKIPLDYIVLASRLISKFR
tara:strand:- start:1634 stop:2707 length:1074 start_codon:yes stop_codon:yes gene_type:complete